jgi:hypothetical protein
MVHLVIKGSEYSLGFDDGDEEEDCKHIFLNADVIRYGLRLDLLNPKNLIKQFVNTIKDNQVVLYEVPQQNEVNFLMKVQALLKRAKVGSFIQEKVSKIAETNLSKVYKYNDSVIKHPQVGDEAQRTSILAQAIYES